MEKPIEIMDKKLFKKDSMRKTSLHDIPMDIGVIELSGKLGIQSIYLDAEDHNYQAKHKWVLDNMHYIGFTEGLPDEAAGIWLEAYNDATIDGKAPDEAVKLAWQAVKEKYYQDKSGRWVKLTENWTDEVTKQLTPTIEVLRTGVYHDSEGKEIEITETQLDEMIRNFAEIGYRPPVTNDHRQDGVSLGKVEKLFRIGKKLFATLSNLIPKFVDSVRKGLYANRSAEFYPDFIDGDGQSRGAMFKAITFLGVKPPAIKDLGVPQFSESGISYALSIDKDDYCIKLTELKPLDPKGDTSLALPKTQEELDQIVKLAEEKAVDVALKNKEGTHADEVKKLSDENLALKKQLDDQKLATAESEAKKLCEHYNSKEGGGKILPAQNEFWTGQFKKALLSEDSDKAIEALKKTIEAGPDLVKFAELTKEKENHQTDDGAVKFSEEGQEQMKKICAFLDSHKMEYSIDELGIVKTKNPDDYRKAYAAVKKQG